MISCKSAIFAEEVRVRDWTALRPGDLIQVEELSGSQQTGIVDEVSEAGNVLWIRYSGLNSRRLIHSTEIAEITCRSTEFDALRLAALIKDRQ